MASKLKIDPATLDFELGDQFIAQEPLKDRSHARLMVLHRSNQQLSQVRFNELVTLLTPSDVLVLNVAQVNRTKLVGRKKTGGRVEIILLSPWDQPFLWKALVRPLVSVGSSIEIAPNVALKLVDRTPAGENILDLSGVDLDRLLKEYGKIPLPPYIKRSESDPRSLDDDHFYQTVYAEVPGSVAAPTAGLHFSADMLSDLVRRGVQVAKLVLHVGWGTFKPVQSVSSHVMLSERYEVSQQTLKILMEAKQNGKRIVAVGTTVTRVLESLPKILPESAVSGETDIFIKPGHQFRWVDALITNFHVPRSTPISLVCAFAGFEFVERAYSMAVEQNYRFFSYGDAMFIQ